MGPLLRVDGTVLIGGQVVRYRNLKELLLTLSVDLALDLWTSCKALVSFSANLTLTFIFFCSRVEVCLVLSSPLVNRN